VSHVRRFGVWYYGDKPIVESPKAAASLSDSATVAVDKSRCAEEPIHIPGSIQPHGMLLVLSDPKLIVVQVSPNIETMLGIPVAAVRRAAVSTIFGAAGSNAL
jgi:two-component system, chemotaxis family, sensor kinase Cph1